MKSGALQICFNLLENRRALPMYFQSWMQWISSRALLSDGERCTFRLDLPPVRSRLIKAVHLTTVGGRGQAADRNSVRSVLGFIEAKFVFGNRPLFRSSRTSVSSDQQPSWLRYNEIDRHNQLLLHRMTEIIRHSPPHHEARGHNAIFCLNAYVVATAFLFTSYLLGGRG